MSTAVQAAALACVVAGLLSAALVLVASRNALLSLRVLVDLLVAAGLLQLSGDPDAWALATAAALVALRQLLSWRRHRAAG